MASLSERGRRSSASVGRESKFRISCFGDSRVKISMVADDNLRRDRARQLRRDETEAEKKLWARLRAGRLHGVKFRRQFPIGPFFADFCAAKESLVIELDGSQHMDMTDSDDRRTKHLESLGYRVLRFWDHEALASADDVIERINDALNDKSISKRPRAGGVSQPGRGAFRPR